MNYLDMLPMEILHVIAEDSEPAYLALVRAYPRFAREITPGRRVDYMVGFGHDVTATKNYIKWTRNGKRHRVGLPAVIYMDAEEWHHDGLLHRVGGPAITVRDEDPYEVWYHRGQMHRSDGPALIYADGEIVEWYRRGVRVDPRGPGS